MAKTPSYLNDLTARIADLHTQLEQEKDLYKRMSLLDELSFHLRLIDPKEGAHYAREELRIASSLKDTHWILRSCIRLGNTARSRSQYLMAERYFRKALQLLETSSDDPAEKAYVLRNLGLSMFETGRTEAALEMVELSLQLAERSQDEREIAASYDGLSQIYITLGLYSQGLACRKKALEMHEARSFQSGIGVSLWDIGNIFAALGDWEMALENYYKGLKIHQQIGNVNAQTQSYLNIGSVYAQTHQWEEGINACHKALELSQSIGNLFMCGQAHVQIGHIRIAQEEYKSGFASLHQAECLFKEIGNSVGKGMVLLEKGRAFIQRKKWLRAISTLTESREILNQSRTYHYLLHLEQLLADAYEQQGNLEKSLHHYKRFIQLEQVLLNNEIRHELTSYQFRELMRTVEEEKEIYRAKNRQLQHEVEAHSKQITFLSLRIGQDDELLKQLRRRIRDLKHANEHTISMINGLIRDIDDRVERTGAWATFKKEMEALDGKFVRRLAAKKFSLTKSEIRICLLLRLNMSNKEIASLLSIAERTVDTHRTNIRRKLGINSKENLVTALSRI